MLPFRLWGLMRNSHIRAERVSCFGVLDGRQLALVMLGYIQLNSTQLPYNIEYVYSPHIHNNVFPHSYILGIYDAHYIMVKPTAMVYTGYSSAQWEPLQKDIHLSR